METSSGLQGLTFKLFFPDHGVLRYACTIPLVTIYLASELAWLSINITINPSGCNLAAQHLYSGEGLPIYYSMT